MAQKRGYPDRRGMGAESDTISEQFVPNRHYLAQREAMIQTLLAAGMSQEQVARMFPAGVDLPSPGEPEQG